MHIKIYQAQMNCEIMMVLELMVFAQVIHLMTNLRLGVKMVELILWGLDLQKK